MDEEMASVMKYLKWNNNGFRVVFANEENKILENKVNIIIHFDEYQRRENYR